MFVQYRFNAVNKTAKFILLIKKVIAKFGDKLVYIYLQTIFASIIIL